MMSMTTFPLMAFLFTLLALVINNSHFLMSLLCLEGMMLTMIIYVPMVMNMASSTSPASALILLTFGACEASLGLSIMVKMSRHYGSDLMTNININKC